LSSRLRSELLFRHISSVFEGSTDDLLGLCRGVAVDVVVDRCHQCWFRCVACWSAHHTSQQFATVSRIVRRDSVLDFSSSSWNDDDIRTMCGKMHRVNNPAMSPKSQFSTDILLHSMLCISRVNLTTVRWWVVSFSGFWSNLNTKILAPISLVSPAGHATPSMRIASS